MSRNKYYHKYEKQLNKAGYTVDAEGYVWDASGNQAAGEDTYGNVQSKDPNVTEICRIAESSGILNKIKKAVKPKKKMKRARNDKGHYVADDPNTPENEAWVEDKG